MREESEHSHQRRVKTLSFILLLVDFVLEDEQCWELIVILIPTVSRTSK